MRVGSVLGSRMLFFMSFTSGVLYGKLINTMKGITGAVAPLTSLARVRSPPMKHRRPPMKFRRPEVWFLY